MKKYLMTGIAALAMCAGFVSCSHDEDVYDVDAVNNLIVANYNQAFVKTFGQVSPNQEWGFGSSNTRGVTRATSVIKQDMTGYPSATAPAAITPEEADFVTKWFQKNPGLTDEGLDISNFYLQYVSGDDENKPGIWHHYDQNANPSNWDTDFSDNGGMDYLVVGASETENVHVNDFNAKSGGPFGIVYIQNGSALKFGYHSTWDNSDQNSTHQYYYFKLAEIDVPGIGKGYYVGLSLYAKKYDNGEKELGIQRLEYAEDWILKIVPAHTNAIRVFAEDLSASDATDFDFNDVVFDAEYVNDTQAKITVWCAGGILPLRINSKNGVGGFEVHEALGLTIEDSCMINTHAKEVAKKPYTWQDNVKKYETIITIPEGKFEENNFPKGVRDLIRVEVKKYIKATNEYKWFELTAAKGEPACKIAGPVGTSLGIKWLLERKPITSGYPKFADYVHNGYPVNWWSENVNEKVLYGINGYSTKCAICHE
jgi:hypothetical protein